MIIENLSLRANVTVDIVDAVTGRRLRRICGHNRVVTAGLNLLRDLLSGVVATPLTYFGYGTDNTSVTLADVALNAQVARDTITSFTSDNGQLTVKYYLASTAGNGNTIKEIGLFTASVAGTMYARYVLESSVVKTSAVAVIFTWTLSWTGDDMPVFQKGAVIDLGGRDSAFTVPSGSDVYPAGATFDKLVPGSGAWYIDSSDLVGGTFVLEAVAKVDAAGARAKVALFNLDDGAPNTALTGSEITFTADNTTGERKRSSTITFPAPGTAKQLAAKVTCNSGVRSAAAWNIRIVRTA